eukprot:TRINITY_DN573_c0_g1_i1.p1 TRINITY_DN573_c0_g1~~TRINITY_DN573_c0_g1_i1.p1  ORF type:complete len:247 (+),score=84.46 TRINITY_DN573_c0_g1_i1:69-809(+)
MEQRNDDRIKKIKEEINNFEKKVKKLEELEVNHGKRVIDVISNQASTCATVAALIGGFAITGLTQASLEQSPENAILTMKTLMAVSFLLEMFVIFASSEIVYLSNRMDTRKELIKISFFFESNGSNGSKESNESFKKHKPITDYDPARIVYNIIEIPMMSGIIFLILAVIVYVFNELSTACGITITIISAIILYLIFFFNFYMRYHIYASVLKKKPNAAANCILGISALPIFPIFLFILERGLKKK